MPNQTRMLDQIQNSTQRKVLFLWHSRTPK